MSQFSVSGAVSGLDTASLINSLMAVEGQQQTALTNRQSSAQKAADAYTSLISSLTGLADQARTLAKTTDWTGSSVSSSAASVSVKATGTQDSSLTFDVTQVAVAHALISSEGVASTGVQVASGPLTLTAGDGSVTSIDVGDGSLASVVKAINGADAGLVATAVKTGAGSFRLQVAAKDTGADTAFTLDGLTGFTGMNVLSQGQDAQLTIGTNPATQYQITSASNTFSDLVDGMSFTVSKAESGVTVSSKVDGSTVADSVSKLVDTANSVLANLAKQTAVTTANGTSTSGALAGESSVRQVTQRILSAVGGANAPGVHLTRDGKLSFDRTAFLSAFEADPAVVADAFGASSSFSPVAGVNGSAEVTRAGDGTRAGSYGLNVTVAALPETWQLDPPGAMIAGRTIVVSRGSTTISYTAGAGESMADVIAALDARLSRAGFGVTASENNGSLMLTAASKGAAQAFTASLDAGSATQVTAGRDVAGTIDGQEAVGTGDLLSLRTGTGGAVGLTVRTTFDDADVSASGGAVGTLDYTPGLAQSLLTVIKDATASSTGTLTTAKQSRQDAVDDLQKQIDNWTTRLDAKRLALQRQFTAMETTLATLKSQTSALSSLGTSSSSSG